MADLPSDETVEVIVRAGSTSNNEMEVNSDGSINIEYRDLTRISVSGSYANNVQDIPAGAKSLILSGIVPSGKTWLVTNLIVGGKGKGTAELAVVDSSGIVNTLLDACDSVTSWAKGGSVDSFSLDTTDKYEGTASIKSVLDFSGAGLQTGKLTKTYGTTLNLTVYDSIALYAKASENNCALCLKIFQGGSSYTFTSQIVSKNSWTKISFDLSEILLFTPNAVDKIEVNFVETTNYKKDFNIWIDYIHGATGELKQTLNTVYFPSFETVNIMYPRYWKIAANSVLNIYITNNDATMLPFAGSYVGLEVPYVL